MILDDIKIIDICDYTQIVTFENDDGSTFTRTAEQLDTIYYIELLKNNGRK